MRWEGRADLSEEQTVLDPVGRARVNARPEARTDTVPACWQETLERPGCTSIPTRQELE